MELIPRFSSNRFISDLANSHSDFLESWQYFILSQEFQTIIAI